MPSDLDIFLTGVFGRSALRPPHPPRTRLTNFCNAIRLSHFFDWRFWPVGSPHPQTSAMPSDLFSDGRFLPFFPLALSAGRLTYPPTLTRLTKLLQCHQTLPFFRWALSVIFPTGAFGRSAHLPPPPSIRSSRVHNVGKVIGNF